MSGLIVVATTVAGGVVGGTIGFVGSLFYADMEIGNLMPLFAMAGGAAAGAVVGAYIGGQVVT